MHRYALSMAMENAQMITLLLQSTLLKRDMLFI